jgi:uncharacterized protein YPO0396
MSKQADRTDASNLDDLWAAGQIRLANLSVFNWGSFDGLHSAAIDPVGTLITGDNGAGKSTLIDGLMALLLPAGRATFNVAAAQGDRTDRSLLSYMRGSFGSAHDGSGTRVKSKREGAVVTALRAQYQADDGSSITLAALFWIAQASNAMADVKRLYIVSSSEVSLKYLLDNFGKGDVRSLKNLLKQDPALSYCDNNFTEYQEVYRRTLHMDNKNAPALLSRALGLKKIDDLTDLIRGLVLEPSAVKEDAKKVVAEFADLVATHDQLVDAKARQQALARLPVIDADLQAVESTLQILADERDALPRFIAECCALLWQARARELESLLKRLMIDIEQLSERETQGSARVEQCHAAYIQAGGSRIEALKKDIEHARKELERTASSANVYQSLCKVLGLEVKLERFCFEQNLELAAETLSNIEGERKRVQILFADKHAEFLHQETAKKTLSETIKAIESRPGSNVDHDYQILKDTLVNALGFEAEEVVFAAELIDVASQHKSWQGAIERALGGVRTALLVPEGKFHLVTRWLNQTHTGLLVRVQAVEIGAAATKKMAVFKQKGYLRKLEWKEHAYREWLKHYLSRFDLHCVDTTEALDATPFSLTQKGLMHKERGRAEKNDRIAVHDQRKWQLGFSNKSRLALLKDDEKRLTHELTRSAENAVAAQKAMNATEARANDWKALSGTQWGSIDAPRWQGESKQLKAELLALESADGDLLSAKNLWDKAKEELALIRVHKNTKSNEFAVNDQSLARNRDELEKCHRMAVEGIADTVRDGLQKRVGEVRDEHLDDIVTLEHQHSANIQHQHQISSNKKQTLTNEATGIMGAFRQKWDVFAVEWGAGIASLSDYLEHLNTLEAEGLPALVEQFKERLNRHTTQSIATIKSRIDAEREDISERIETINAVLKRTEFKPGSYLKLGLKSEQFPHVVAFNAKVGAVLSQATSDDHESRFMGLQEVVEILDRASASGSAHNMESLRLLDPRHQLSFYAEEIEGSSQKVLDVLESSSGKSGGEKESFAGTIVAASLAYVLTPDGYDKPVYSTVFLDEAFSNTAEAVSRRVLRVFNELNIHVNLITPYKNLNLARESARSLIIAERDQATHESRLCEVTWEEIDRQSELQAKRRLHAEAGLETQLEAEQEVKLVD